MADVGIGIKRVIQDVDGEAATVTNNRLDVNAYLSAGSVNVGDIDVLSIIPGTGATNLGKAEDASHTSGDVGVMTLAVRNDTLAALGGADGDYAPLQVNADGALYVDTADGSILESAVDNLENLGTLQTTANNNTGTTATNTGNTVTLLGVGFASGTGLANTGGIEFGANYGTLSMAVRNDTLANDLQGAAADTDGDIANLQVNSIGGLYVTGSEVENAAVQSQPHLIGGRYDSSARTLGSGDAGAVALNASGHVLMDVVDGGQLDTIIDTLETTLTAIETDQAAIETLLTGIDSDTNNAQGYLSNLSGTQYVDDADWTDGSSKHLLVGGLYQSSMQSVTDGDVAPFQVDANGVLKVSPSTGSEFQVDVVSGSIGHDITGMQSDNNEGVDDSTAEVLKSSTACKRVDMQADPSNTGYIYVGGSDVSATKGIRLAPGDFYSIDCDNTADIYVLASVDEEDIHFTYFT